MTLDLPPEICGIICQYSKHDRDALRALCAVSKSFRNEAERLLYVFVTLSNLRLIKSWCLSISRRPHLALRVVYLVLVMPPSTDMMPDDMSKITSGLHACSNLRGLEVHSDGRGTPGDSVQTWILDGHSFKLEKFYNTYFHIRYLNRFLYRQSDIKFLVLPLSQQDYELPASREFLPKVTTLNTSATFLQQLDISSWRNKLVNLQYSLDNANDEEELSTFATLILFRESLISLSIIRHGGENGLDMTMTLACVAYQLPGIKFLRVIDDTELNQQSSVPLIPFPIVFPCLETLIMKPPSYAFGGSIFPGLGSEDGRIEAAVRIMNTLSSLLRLVFITDRNYGFKRALEGDISVVSLGVIELDDLDWTYPQ